MSTTKIPPSRMICMVRPISTKGSANITELNEFLVPIPPRITEQPWTTVADVFNVEQKNKQKGTAQPIIPKKTAIILGNAAKTSTGGLMPLCITSLVPKKIDPDYFQTRRCVQLHTTKPAEYNRKWTELGCPYWIDANEVNKFNASTVKDILPFRKTGLKYYANTANRAASEMPITRKEFRDYIKAHIGHDIV